VEFRILGPLEVLDGDRPVEIAGSKRRAVLALLLLHANEVVRTERLIDDLWGDHAPRNAAAALHSHVSRLRKALGPDVLVRREWGYVLRTNPESFDLGRFERLVADAEPLPARERSARLAEALQLWRGPALADLGGEEGLKGEIARLDELRLAIVERRIDADLEAGRNAELVGEIEALIAAHPLRERLRGQLILALYRAGRQVEALEVYRETRRLLADELGLEPSLGLRELERAILRQDPELAAAVAPIELNRGQPPPPEPGRRLYLGAVAVLVLAALAALAALLATRGTSAAKNAASSAADVPTQTTATTTASTRNHTVRHANTAIVVHHKVHPTKNVAPAQTTTTTSTTAAAPRRSKQQSAAPASHSGTVPTTEKTSAPTKPKQSTKPFTISDTFAGDYVDPTIWHEARDGGDVSMVERGGQLQLTVGADAVPGGKYNQIDVHVGTQCSFPANFDARVDYTLLEWPSGDNIDVGLNAIFANGAVMRDSSSRSGDEYASWVIPSSGSVALADTSGSLRIVRVNGIETTYFRHQGSWRKLASATAPGVAVLGLQAFSDGHDPFGGKELKVAFDNFKVTATSADCPPGSVPTP
jgi:DNA-binding SARP family transcriptional activator